MTCSPANSVAVSRRCHPARGCAGRAPGAPPSIGTRRRLEQRRADVTPVPDVEMAAGRARRARARAARSTAARARAGRERRNRRPAGGSRVVSVVRPSLDGVERASIISPRRKGPPASPPPPPGAKPHPPPSICTGTGPALRSVSLRARPTGDVGVPRVPGAGHRQRVTGQRHLACSVTAPSSRAGRHRLGPRAPGACRGRRQAGWPPEQLKCSSATLSGGSR